MRSLTVVFSASMCAMIPMLRRLARSSAGAPFVGVLDAVVLDMANLGTCVVRAKRVRKISGTWLVRESCRRDLSSKRSVRGVPLPAVAAVMAIVLLFGLIVVWYIQRPPRHTSIVLVVLDTVRADHCSAYGYGKPTTPRLERLASE